MSWINEGKARFLVESYTRKNWTPIRELISADDSDDAELKFAYLHANKMTNDIHIRDLRNAPCSHLMSNVDAFFAIDREVSDICSVCENS
jgi:hypothetical protein